MSRSHRTRRLLLVLIWTGGLPAAIRAGGAVDAHPASADLPRGGAGFRVHQTEHFTIAYDTPYERLRPLTARTEGVYDAILRFCRGLNLTVREPVEPLPVVLFSKYEDFEDYARRAGVQRGSAAGFYKPQTNIAAFVDVLASPMLEPVHDAMKQLESMVQTSRSSLTASGRNQVLNQLNALRARRDSIVEDFNRVVLQHEAAHQVFFNIGVHARGAPNPAWLVEGLACQFEVPQSDLRGDLRRVNQMRLGDLRGALSASGSGAGAGGATGGRLEPRRLISLPELVSVHRLEGGDSKTAAASYAQAWGLVYYLHRQQRTAFATYVRALSAREAGEKNAEETERADFERAFGKVDDRFVEDFFAHISKLRFDPSSR